MAAGLVWRLVGPRLVWWLVGTQLEHVVGSELGLGRQLVVAGLGLGRRRLVAGLEHLVGSELGLGRGLGLGRLGPVDQLRLDDGAGDGRVGHVG